MLESQRLAIEKTLTLVRVLIPQFDLKDAVVVESARELLRNFWNKNGVDVKGLVFLRRDLSKAHVATSLDIQGQQITIANRLHILL
jgi:hypothetical protein